MEADAKGEALDRVMPPTAAVNANTEAKLPEIGLGIPSFVSCGLPPPRSTAHNADLTC